MGMTADIDPEETKEWLDALESLLATDGKDRAQYVLTSLLKHASSLGCQGFEQKETQYTNTISPDQQPSYPGDLVLERRIRAMIRWNAAVMVLRAGKRDASLGGHIGTFASAATLYDVGFNHFWRAPNEAGEGDMIFYQGHSSPGIYARSLLEGRFDKQLADRFRQEATAPGLSSYPHPWLMPNYWQFPTVSMGLGPLQAIYQARFMRYLQAAGLVPTNDRKVWCFCGDGEMDEPESLGTLSIAAREKLDNLIFVINCNLQRLDGPVRGNYKIIPELERIFLGYGWHVIKVIWGSNWEELFARDTSGKLLQLVAETVDGDFQTYHARGGKYTRENFFGKYKETAALVAAMSDDEIANLTRGGHEPEKVYAAYKQAVEHTGQPVVILAKTVKGYGLGSAGEAMNTAHNAKKMAKEQLLAFRDRFDLTIATPDAENAEYYLPDSDSAEIKYMRARREALGGFIPARRVAADEKLTIPPLSAFQALLDGSGDREVSTTMGFVRIIAALCKDKQIGRRIVPIVPDEARTFGMEGLFRQVGIYSAFPQKYTPVDSEQVMFYKEAQDGQILEEGLNEAGAFASFMASASSYSNHNVITIPFYIYYSMFGFQRIGDLAWAAGDLRAKGFLIGATSGRTTLNGEGLQHEDGHNHVIASTIPNCISYDPTFNYELAVIIHHGMNEMYARDKAVFYYITTMNENYKHAKMPEGVTEGIIKGIYRLSTSDTSDLKVQLLGSGSILNEVIAAGELLKQEFSIAADIWSVTSFTELGRDGQTVARENRLNLASGAKQQLPYVTSQLEQAAGPVIAATDYMRQYAEQIRSYVPNYYLTLGTDGFGRSDSREVLRGHFEVDRYHIAFAALYALWQSNQITENIVQDAKDKLKIDPNKINPLYA